MKKLFFFFLWSLTIGVFAQNKSTQDSLQINKRGSGPQDKAYGQYPAKSKLEKMANVPLPLSVIRLVPGINKIDLRDYVLIPESVREVFLDNQKLKCEGRYCEIKAPIAKPIQVLKLVFINETLEIPVFNTDKQTFEFKYTPQDKGVKKIFIAGSFNGWSNTSNGLTKEKDGKWGTTFNLEPGEHAYRIWEDGKEMLDANNPLKKDNGLGGQNSYFVINGEKKSQSYLSSEMVESKNIIAQLHGRCDQLFAFYNNHSIPVENKSNRLVITIPSNATEGYVTVFAYDKKTRLNDLLIPVHQGVAVLNERFLARQDQHSQIMYFMMVDRFADGRQSNNFPTIDPEILPKANTMGGDLVGIQQKINQSYFSQLGVNTLWLSPICQNVEGAWGLWDKGVKSKFSAYHGYWPLALTKLDKRFGTEKDLDSLIETAHQRQLNIVLDYVAHHVHQEHPLIKEKKGWTTPLYLPDGTMNTERWDDHRLTTWFDTFLPTFDFSKPEVVNALSDTALYWIRRFPIDGFRHDATKHIHTEFWKELTYKIKRERHQTPLYQIGETYGSPELISSYLSSGMLDAQFDFNLYDAAVDAFAKDRTDFKNLQRVLEESMRYYGHHHLMGNITGNQDRARFISYADGSIKFDEDPKLAGWTREITNRGTAGYRKLEQLMAFIMTTPGVPCIYYGDEIGMPGANDPDNRRMMQFDQLNAEQRKLKSSVTRLTHTRSNHMALTYGDTRVLRNDSVFAYVRQYFGDVVLVVFDKKDRNPKDSIWLSIPVQSEWLTKNFIGEMGGQFKVEKGVWKVNLSGKGYDVFVPRSGRTQTNNQQGLKSFKEESVSQPKKTPIKEAKPAEQNPPKKPQ